jgi:hypothetical protein
MPIAWALIVSTRLPFSVVDSRFHVGIFAGMCGEMCVVRKWPTANGASRSRPC